MRNVFDQYSQNENKLTHAFASALHEDSGVLFDFMKTFLGISANAKLKRVKVIEQSYPGVPQMTEKDAEAAGIPDIWIKPLAVGY